MKKKISFVCLAVLALLLVVACNPNTPSPTEYLEPGEYNRDWLDMEFDSYEAYITIYKPTGDGQKSADLKITATGENVRFDGYDTPAQSKTKEIKIATAERWITIDGMPFSTWHEDKVDLQLVVEIKNGTELTIHILDESGKALRTMFADSFSNINIVLDKDGDTAFADMSVTKERWFNEVPEPTSST